MNKSSRYSHLAFGCFLRTTAGSPAHTLAIALILLVAAGLAGCGLTAGALVAIPSSVNFGSVMLGTTATQTVTLSNLGSSALVVTTVNMSGSPFGVGGLTLPLTLPAGKTFTFQAQFTPKAAGQANGTLTVRSSASDLKVPLSGAGTSQRTPTSHLTVNPGNVSFGNVTDGTSSSQTIQLTNSGAASLTINQASVSGAGFSISGLSTPLALAAGQSTTFNAVFAPQSPGGVTGSISFADSNAPDASAALSGTGVAQNQSGQLSMNPSSVSFGSVSDGTSSSQTIQLTNSGAGSLTINQASASGTGFSISGLSTPLALAAGQSTTFNAVFAPQSPGGVTGIISFADSNAPNASIALSGTGVATSLQLSANPSSLTFGNVTVRNSSTLSVNLTNTGNSSVSVQKVSASGAGFSASNAGLPVTLTAGQSVSVNVVFAPQSAGGVSGSLAVTSTASNSPTVGLSGAGVQTVSHSAALSWDPSTSTVSGYNVYRGAQSGGPYTKLTSSLDAGTAYTDSSVSSGTTYFYVVTAVDSSGNESAFSNEATAAIP